MGHTGAVAEPPAEVEPAAAGGGGGGDPAAAASAWMERRHVMSKIPTVQQ